MSNLVRIDGRTKGQFPVSIATSLALEGMFGILEDNFNPNPPWLDYTDLVVNVRTLFRNLVGSIENESETNNTPIDYAYVLTEEMSLIRNYVTERSSGKINVQFYVCDYHSLTGFYPFAFFKEVKSEKQKMYARMENNTIEYIFKELKLVNDYLTAYDTNVLLEVRKTLLMTHFPLDLLHIRKASEVALLESHTGVVKRKHKWNTKLNNSKNLPPIPFDRMTVQVFGDSGHLFSPYPLEIRKKLIKVAEENNWHTATTKERILQTVKLVRDPVFVETIRKLYL